jgi:hypothetical protein
VSSLATATGGNGGASGALGGNGGVGGDAKARAPCFWVYAYPAFLRYAAHSAGGYWARILAQASEIAS